ncbi:MAG: VanW family protein [Mobilitalea sp.]
MSRSYKLISAVFLLAISFLFTGNAIYAAAAENDNTICTGVFIDEVDVSGMTSEEAASALEKFISELSAKGVAITVGEDIIYTTMGDIGYSCEPHDGIEQAIGLGKEGNLIKRYKDRKDIEQGTVVYPLTFTFDESKLTEILSVEAAAYDIAPVNATYTRENGAFVYTEHKVGTKVNVEKTVELFKNAIVDWNRQDIIIDAVREDDVPQYTVEDLEKCNTVLGTFTTNYSSSAAGRAMNLANGAKLINNAVLYPGDVFSGYEYLTPFTAENGYAIAGAYLQGKVIESVGGGACQVTTTLYNAVLAAELNIVERSAHSMVVTYVDLSRDAAIAGDYKDFKFMNSTESPILIEAKTHDREITFTIWGEETRDTANRRIKFESVTTSTTAAPADVITKDKTKPTTYHVITQSAHTGYRAELYKVIYENDVEVGRVLINKSSYAAAPRYVTVGTKEIKEEKPEVEPTVAPTDPTITPIIEEEIPVEEIPVEEAPIEETEE